MPVVLFCSSRFFLWPLLLVRLGVSLWLKPASKFYVSVLYRWLVVCNGRLGRSYFVEFLFLILYDLFLFVLCVSVVCFLNLFSSVFILYCCYLDSGTMHRLGLIVLLVRTVRFYSSCFYIILSAFLSINLILGLAIAFTLTLKC